ncbi:hypothetical protein HanRHA438_Chr07g0307001 [Helianthus annuus]|uniref:Uncharacterized protein n=1 Tax=Helianthus annuus TaxID=4232 RepID=A0A9K3IKM7_HELAN|nr:hypothetical protein HanXRQr2_Chr07g0296691 [Helianthus annuus]KAJ0550321.1 hypothetical protein HanHA300_Chr07g0244091 [Helianthus annuus]KAJ0557010.1 hypothetical protein HanIR_Chr07g0320291 [Helianthus annuus]KAJ0563275.1 hypothetical protein HanHA89_Chr07g0261271 [Helianthus annuus]KAJ0731379.1 hypothetical protein HanOQP8_Chr07g0251291 [Helianthus annuus]
MFLLGSYRYERCMKLCTMEIGGHVGSDWDLLETITGAARAREIVGLNIPFARLFQIAIEDSYCEITLEFLTSFIYEPHPDDYVEDPDHPTHEITFCLVGQEFQTSLRDFAVHSGLYTLAELDTNIYIQGVRALDRHYLITFWMPIARVPFGKSSQKATAIKNPLYRYLHCIIGSSIVPRFHNRDKVNLGDLLLYTAYCGASRVRYLRAWRSTLLAHIIGSSARGTTAGLTLPLSRAY